MSKYRKLADRAGKRAVFLVYPTTSSMLRGATPAIFCQGRYGHWAKCISASHKQSTSSLHVFTSPVLVSMAENLQP